MITEDYVSFEVAKLLKEKGFDEECRGFFHTAFESPRLSMWSCKDHKNSDYEECVSTPTHQMAMKWLRNEHNILLFLLPAQENGKLVYLVEVWTWNEEESIYESTYAPMPKKEPEQAVEAALKYTLKNLI
jgi:hypothetical protein